MFIATNKILVPTYLLRTIRTRSADYVEVRDSINDLGILQPILVRPVESGYEVVDGNVRFHCAMDLQLKEVPCNVRRMSDRAARIAQIHLNSQRIETLPSEYMRSLKDFVQEGMSIDEIAGMFCKRPNWVREKLKIAELPGSVLLAVNEGKISDQNAYQLSRLPESQINTFIHEAKTVPSRDFRSLVSITKKENRARYEVSQRLRRIHRGIKMRRREQIAREFAEQTIGPRLMKRAGLTTPLEGFYLALDWVLRNT